MNDSGSVNRNLLLMITVALWAGFVAAQAPTANPPASTAIASRQPVPAETRQAEALRLAREAYQDEYAQAQTPATRRALAKKLLQKGVETADDPIARFVLLRLARDIALKAEDQNLAFEAIDRLAEGFVIDPWTMKAEIVASAARQARKTADHETAAGLALLVMRKALEQDACAVAQEMAKLAILEGGKARDKELVAQARAGQKQAQQAAKALEQIESARAMLKDNPDDATANLTVGRYECFAKGDWASGLAHLTKASDPTLKSLAQDDLKSPDDSASRLKIADAWWDLAQNSSGREREGMLVRAGYWYQQLGTIDQSLVRTKIENRLAQIARLGRSIPGEPSALKKTLANSIGMQFVLIPAGEFLMGSSPEETAWSTAEGKKRNQPSFFFWRTNISGPQHKVRISRTFYLGVYEVTQGEYEQVMRTNPSSLSQKGKDADKVAGLDTRRHPVESVSWEEAIQFCQTLSSHAVERAARRVYRLPTEAEWECACRAGTNTMWSFGDNPTAMRDHGWLTPGKDFVTHPVGQKRPNAWGLYDMHGNVSEWCMDWFAPDYYQQSPAIDPVGPSNSSQRVTRGNVTTELPATRVAFRGSCDPKKRDRNLGFRAVCVP